VLGMPAWNFPLQACAFFNCEDSGMIEGLYTNAQLCEPVKQIFAGRGLLRSVYGHDRVAFPQDCGGWTVTNTLHFMGSCDLTAEFRYGAAQALLQSVRS